MSVSIHSSIISFAFLSLACHISALEYAFFGNRRLRLSPSSPVHTFTTSEQKRNNIFHDSRKDDENMSTNNHRLLYGKGYSKGAYKSKGYAMYGSKGYGKDGYHSKGYGAYKSKGYSAYKSKGHGKGAYKAKGSYKSKGYSKGGYSSKYGMHKSRYYGDTRSARTRSEDSDEGKGSNHNRKDTAKNQKDMKDTESKERKEEKRKEREKRAVEKERKERREKEEKRKEREEKKEVKRKKREEKKEEKRKEKEEKKEEKRKEKEEKKEEKSKEKEEEEEKRKEKEEKEEKRKGKEEKEEKRKEREEEKEEKRKEREEEKEEKRKERDGKKDEKRKEREEKKEEKENDQDDDDSSEDYDYDYDVEHSKESNDNRKSKVKRKSNKKDNDSRDSRSSDYGGSLEDDDSSDGYDYDYDYDDGYKHDDTHLSYQYSDDTAGVVDNEGSKGGNKKDENDSDGKDKSKKKDDIDKDKDDKGKDKADGKGDKEGKDEDNKKSDEDGKNDGKDKKDKGVKSKDSITCQERKGGNQSTGIINYKYTMETLVDEVDKINEKLTNAMLIATASDVCQRRRLFESIERHLEVVEVGSSPKDILSGTCKPAFDKENTCVKYDGKMTVTITDEGGNKSFAETRKNIISTLQFYADNGMFSNIDNNLVSVSVYDDDQLVLAEAVAQDTLNTNEVMGTGAKVMISMAAICAILAAILLLRKRRRKLDKSIEVLKDEKEKDSISLATASTDVTPSRRNVISPTHDYDIDRNMVYFDPKEFPDSPSKRYGPAELEAIEEERSSDLPNYYNLGRIHSSQDVHRCRSGSCLGCQQRQHAKTVHFIPMEK